MSEQPYDEDIDDEIRPGDPDYDLSEAHGYLWEPGQREWPPRWLLVVLTVLVIAGLIVPAVILIWRAQ